MASRPRVYISDEVLDEFFADADSEYDENNTESDSYDPRGSEDSSVEENDDKEDGEASEKSKMAAIINEHFQNCNFWDLVLFK